MVIRMLQQERAIADEMTFCHSTPTTGADNPDNP